MMLFDTLTVVGVGLLGGSVGLAARRRGVVRRVIGTDHNPRALAAAQSAGILDEMASTPTDGARQADLVVFCTPVDRIAEHVLAAAPFCRHGTLLTDVGSTKAAILRAIDGRLPPGVTFIGGHPLAGSEKQGADHADANLFENRLVVLTPLGNGDDRAVRFWQALGARVRVMDAEEHDRAVALTSHLPHLAASALAGTLPAELIDLTATGFRDATRLAAGSPDLWTPIFQANRAAVLAGLDAFLDRLELFRAALTAGDGERLQQLLVKGKQMRDHLRPL